MVKVSVVMAVYNGESHLKESIDSILNQTYRRFEFIIVNDGSTDKTKEILESFRDRRLKIYHLEKNHGQTFSLNFGISKARGKWIARQDADDISLPNRLREQLIYLKKHPYLAGVACMIKSIPGNEPVDQSILNGKQWSNMALTNEQIKEFRFVAPPVIHGSMIFSKHFFQAVGSYNEKYSIGQDFDLWIRMLDKGIIEKVPQVLYMYRVEANSLSNIKESQTCKESLTIASSHINKLLLDKLNRQPKLGIIGPASGCQHYLEHICPLFNMNVTHQSHIDEVDDYPEIQYAWGDNQIDAIIVLDGGFSYEVIDRLKQEGLIINQDFFRLWNIF
ncbi:glycosyltransferase family 2 protein [Neobacillus sp. Marseille-QA0830]